MKTKQEQFEVLIPTLDGTAVAERVSVTISLEWDEEFKEWLITPESHRLIEDTKARHMGLLSPAQFVELRKRYGYSQKEMGEIFQVGEKSWTRWESGKHRPSRSTNLPIRALYEDEISINYLLRRAGKPERNEAETKWQSQLRKKMLSQCIDFPDITDILGASQEMPIVFQGMVVYSGKGMPQGSFPISGRGNMQTGFEGFTPLPPSRILQPNVRTGRIPSDLKEDDVCLTTRSY